jgi:predicted thioesterase
VETRDYVQIGLKGEGDFNVVEEYTAGYIGSGSLDVLATSGLVAFMERIAHSMLEQRLPEGYSSVGTLVEIHHLAPTLVGGSVHVQCEVIEVDDRRVTFDVQAWDETGMIGKGRHQRVIIDVKRFLQRLHSR